MPDDRYTRTDRNGTPSKTGKFDKYTLFNLARAEEKLGYDLTVIQGGYNAGGVAASAGTHDGAGVVDLLAYDHARKVKALRSVGFAAWYRPPNWDNRGGGAHIHAVLIGNTHASAGAKAQVSAYRRFKNGLANNAADLTWHSPIYLVKSAPYRKPTKITIAQYNLPGPDKIGNAAARIKAGVALVKKSNPHIIGWNELVGTKSNGGASTFAVAVDHMLGPKWKLVKPTLPLNENYISYRSDRLTVVKQYDDSVLEAKTGGRHLTRVVFKHANGLVFAVGQTHLVNDGGAQGETDRQLQAKDAMKSMQAVSAKHGDCPFVIQGDMNTHRNLTALVKIGMKRTRAYADKGDGAKATYTNYDKTVPSINSTWEIDQQYVSAGFYVHTYNVLRALAGRLYRKPRPSDHDATVSTISA